MSRSTRSKSKAALVATPPLPPTTAPKKRGSGHKSPTPSPLSPLLPTSPPPKDPAPAHASRKRKPNDLAASSRSSLSLLSDGPKAKKRKLELPPAQPSRQSTRARKPTAKAAATAAAPSSPSSSSPISEPSSNTSASSSRSSAPSSSSSLSSAAVPVTAATTTTTTIAGAWKEPPVTPFRIDIGNMPTAEQTARRWAKDKANFDLPGVWAAFGKAKPARAVLRMGERWGCRELSAEDVRAACC